MLVPDSQINLKRLPFQPKDLAALEAMFPEGFNEQEYANSLLKSREAQANYTELPALLKDQLWNPLLEGVNRSDQILDFGSGGAFHVEALPEEYRERLTLLDICGSILHVAKKNYPKVGILRRNFFDTGLPDGSVARISGFNADTPLGEESDLRSLLTEAFRVLAPGGKMILFSINTPQLEWAKVPGLDRNLPPELYYSSFRTYRPKIVSNFQEFKASIASEFCMTCEVCADEIYKFSWKSNGQPQATDRPVLRFEIDKPI